MIPADAVFCTEADVGSFQCGTGSLTIALAPDPKITQGKIGFFFAAVARALGFVAGPVTKEFTFTFGSPIVAQATRSSGPTGVHLEQRPPLPVNYARFNGAHLDRDRSVQTQAAIGTPSDVVVFNAYVDARPQLTTNPAGRAALVWVQNPLRLGKHDEPQPDVLLLRPHPGGYRKAHPTPADVLLVIEVADRSVRYDRETKLRLYAAAGIPEAWLVNLPSDTIETCADPGPNGYRTVPMTAGVKNDSLATPLDMALSSGGTLYVAAFGSSAIGTFAASDIEAPIGLETFGMTIAAFTGCAASATSSASSEMPLRGCVGISSARRPSICRICRKP